MVKQSDAERTATVAAAEKAGAEVGRALAAGEVYRAPLTDPGLKAADREQAEAELEHAEKLLHDGPSLPPRVRTMTVSWGEETYQPIQFHGFRVGPLSMTLDIPAGCDLDSFARDAFKRLEKMGNEQFSRKLRDYLDRVEIVVGEVERRKR